MSERLVNNLEICARLIDTVLQSIQEAKTRNARQLENPGSAHYSAT